MKNLQFLALASIAALAMGSCSNESDLDSTYGDNTLRINATIGGMNTRATDTDWELNDQIGVTFGDNENVLFNYNGTAFTTSETLKVTEAGDVKGYYPYAADLSDEAINFNINSDENIDFLFASTSVTPDSPVANLQFTHRMSRLALKVIDGTDDAQLAASDVTLKIANIATTGSFNTATGIVTPGEANGNYEFSSAEFDKTSAVIVPSYATASTNPVQVIVTVGEKNFVGNITPALLAGNQYSYTLTVKGATIEAATLEITGGITGWTNNDGDGSDLEEQYVLSVGDYLLKDGTTIAPSSLTEANKPNVVGVVYFVGNPQPSTLYAGTVDAERDILKAEAPNATNGLAIAINNAQTSSAKFSTGKDNLSTFFSEPLSENAGKLFNPVGFDKSNTVPTQLCGYNNTRLYQLALTDYSLTCSDFLNLLDVFNSEYAVENASKWYLTSYAEFSKIIENYDTIAASIQKAGGELPQYDTDESGTIQKDNFYWTSDYRNSSNMYVVTLKEVSDISKSIQGKNGGANLGYFRFSIAF